MLTVLVVVVVFIDFTFHVSGGLARFLGAEVYF